LSGARNSLLPETALVWPAAGAGRRRTVCVSGLGGAAGEWAPVAPALARYGEVIALELTLGAARRGDRVLRSAVEHVDRALSAMPDQPLLIGHSMGALASMLVAAGRPRPQGLAGLVLTAPFVPVARHGRSSLATAAGYARDRVLFVADARRRRSSAPRAIDPRTRAAGLAALAAYGLRPQTFHDLAERIDCPVLVVHGGEDHYVPAAFALAAAARHTTWRAAVMAGAGHFPHRDDPAAWLAIVDPWVGRLASR
jgi:pimeloyl-ACP methyl ester carboxylesterase